MAFNETRPDVNQYFISIIAFTVEIRFYEVRIISEQRTETDYISMNVIRNKLANNLHLKQTCILKWLFSIDEHGLWTVSNRDWSEA